MLSPLQYSRVRSVRPTLSIVSCPSATSMRKRRNVPLPSCTRDHFSAARSSAGATTSSTKSRPDLSLPSLLQVFPCQWIACWEVWSCDALLFLFQNTVASLVRVTSVLSGGEATHIPSCRSSGAILFNLSANLFGPDTTSQAYRG